MHGIQTAVKPAVGALVLLLTGCGIGMDEDAVYQSRIFKSNGEKIYYTGNSQMGSAITSQGGTMHAQMHKASCASCHGNEREGKRLYPRFWVVAPSLTRQALTEAHNDDHGDHKLYDRESLGLAISQGVDPAGSELNYAMPRWQMNESDLDDLISFLMAESVDYQSE